MAESQSMVITNHARERSIERNIDLNLVIAAKPPTRKQRAQIALQTEHSSNQFLNKRQYKGRYYLVYKDNVFVMTQPSVIITVFKLQQKSPNYLA